MHSSVACAELQLKGTLEIIKAVANASQTWCTVYLLKLDLVCSQRFNRAAFGIHNCHHAELSESHIRRIIIAER